MTDASDATVDAVGKLTEALEFVADLAIAMGMHGAVPGLANVAPKAYVDIYDLVRRGEFEQARRIQETMISLFRITRQGRSGQSHSAGALSGFKAGLKHIVDED